MSSDIEISRNGAVLVVRMNRPEKKNAITRAMYAAMSKALSDADDDGTVRCVMIAGVPGAFSAGNDIGDFMAYAAGGALGHEVLDFLMALANGRKPIVAAVDGLAIGIGTTINLHCDITVASRRSMFRTPFVDLGLVPEAASSLLAPQIMGRQAAFAMLALSEGCDAEQALHYGLVHKVVSEDEVEAVALSYAEAIAAKPPEALRIARDLMRQPREAVVDRIRQEAEAFSERLKSDEARAAFMAFMSRKK